ncbi:MAG: hypothetical protein IT342_25150 [Candidatus Melainabacteria bacterium]|nr:hypothetical protein [Candidatus Melainabacteria bacterium]
MDGHDGGGHDFGHDGHDAGMGGHFGHHDAYGNVDFSGDGQSTWEALSIGYSHQGDSHDHSSSFGTMADNCGADGPNGSAHASHSHAGNQQQKPNENGYYRARTAADFNGETRKFVAHVVAHGDVNILDHLVRICQKLDVIRLDTFRPSINGEDRTLYELADGEPWLPPYDIEKRPPAGWYPNATGSTRLVTQIWQVGRRCSIWDRGIARSLRMMRRHEWVSDPEYDPDAKTFFEIGVATWNYRETGDHDTLVSIRINSQLVWQPYFGAYGYKKIPFHKHQQAASAIIQELLDVLKAAVPSPEQKRNREFYAVTLPGIEAEKSKAASESPQNSSPAQPFSHGCPPVTDSEVATSGADLVNAIAAVSADHTEETPLKMVDIVVTIPR